MKGTLKILYKKLLISVVIFLLVTAIYVLELNFIRKKLDNLKTQYQQKLSLAFQQEELINKKRNIEDFEKKLKDLTNLSLDDSIKVLQSKMYLQKDKIKDVFEEEKWDIEWKQESPGHPPVIEIKVKKEDFDKFLKFLQDKLIYPEITMFNLESEEGAFKIKTEFAH